MAPSSGEIVSLPNIPQADIDVTDLKAKSTGLILLFFIKVNTNYLKESNTFKNNPDMG